MPIIARSVFCPCMYCTQSLWGKCTTRSAGLNTIMYDIIIWGTKGYSVEIIWGTRVASDGIHHYCATGHLCYWQSELQHWWYEDHEYCNVLEGCDCQRNGETYIYLVMKTSSTCPEQAGKHWIMPNLDLHLLQTIQLGDVTYIKYWAGCTGHTQLSVTSYQSPAADSKYFLIKCWGRTSQLCSSFTKSVEFLSPVICTLVLQWPQWPWCISSHAATLKDDALVDVETIKSL